MQKIYHFSSQNKIGQDGENKIRAYFAAIGIETFSVPLSVNKKGVDFYTVEFGEKVYYEVKTDSMAAKTGNCFLEVISNTSTAKLGFLFTCKSDFILYYVPEFGKFLKIPPPELRYYITFNADKFKIKSCANPGYFSEGLLVPYAELAGIFEEVEVLS